MMQQQLAPYITPEVYLAFERQSETKNEYYDGEIFAMAGASEAHNLIVANTIISIGLQLKGRPCKVYPSDLRVKIKKFGIYAYPDVAVACGKIEFEDKHNDTLLNPEVLIEVLSPSTEAYDRGRKFTNYRTLPSLTDYQDVRSKSERKARYGLHGP